MNREEDFLKQKGEYQEKWGEFIADPAKLKDMTAEQHAAMMREKHELQRAAFEDKPLAQQKIWQDARGHLLDYEYPKLEFIAKIVPIAPGELPPDKITGYVVNPKDLEGCHPDEMAKILGLSDKQKEQIAQHGCWVLLGEVPPKEDLKNMGNTILPGGEFVREGSKYPPSEIKSVPQHHLSSEPAAMPVPVVEAMPILPGQVYQGPVLSQAVVEKIKAADEVYHAQQQQPRQRIT